MLNDAICRTAKPEGKERKLSDEKGLHLHISTTGFKSWRFKYRFGGKERRIVFGPYPEVGLREARDKRDSARRLLRDGLDPGVERKRLAARRKNGVDADKTFKAAALRWHAKQLSGWKPKHAQDVLDSLTTELFPKLGKLELTEVTPGEIRDLLVAVQDRGALETAHRLRGRISRIYQLAIVDEKATSDPAVSVSIALRPIVKRKCPALTKLKDCRAFLIAQENEPAHPTTYLASRLLALTAARPGMIRFAQHPEFEGLETPEPIWRVPADKMKLLLEDAEEEAMEFILPLSRQAVHTIRVAAMFSGNREYLFPSVRHSHRPFSENALSTNYRRVPLFGGRHVPHGWRSSFSTIMNERAIDLDRPGDRAIIDLMLAHVPQGVEAHYNRAAYMKRRRQIAQEWADLLMEGMCQPEGLVYKPRR